MPRAASLAAAIKEASGEEVEIIRGDNGIFDIAVAGKVLYSKHETGQFPEHDEILQLLEKHRS